MIRKIDSGERFYTEIDWLKSYRHFSFDRYYDPENMHFGALRVFNEDWIQPNTGFPMHPHREMEIVTFVISGELEHRDDQGNHGIIRPGEVQRMTAGTGIVHSEANSSADEACHLLQMWVLPAESMLKPGWEQKRFTNEMRRGRLLPVVSGSGEHPDALSIHQDATFYVSSLAAGESVRHEAAEQRNVYVFVIGGEIGLNGTAFSTGGQARCTDETAFDITAKKDTELILIDLP